MGTSKLFLQKLFILLIACDPSAVGAFEASLLPDYSPETSPGHRGSDLYLTCSWSTEDPGEDIHLVTLYRQRRRNRYSDLFYEFNLREKSFLYGDLWNDDRMSVGVSSDDSSAVLTVRNTSCADEGKYLCSINYHLHREPHTTTVYQTISLDEPPSPPKLNSRALGSAIRAGTNISFTCTAETGSPKRGGLLWRIYSSRGPEDVTDGRAITRTVVKDCKESANSTLTLNLDHKHQDLAVACFVYNRHYNQRVQLPTFCSGHLCEQTETIPIV